MRSYALNKLFRPPLSLYFSFTQAKCRDDFACGVHDLQFVQPMCVFRGSGSLHFPLWYNQCECFWGGRSPAEAWPGSWGVKRDWQWRFWEETPNDLDFPPKHWDQDKGQELSKAYTCQRCTHQSFPDRFLIFFELWPACFRSDCCRCFFFVCFCLFFNAWNWFKKNKKFNNIL